MIKRTDHRMMVNTLLTASLLWSCAQNQASEEKPPTKKKPAAEGVPGTPTTIPSDKTDTADASKACDAQWTEHVKYFTVGRKLTYASSISALGQVYPASHNEVVTASTDAQVSRQITLSSTNSVAKQVLAQLKIPNPVVVTKESFLKLCTSANGTAQPSVSFGGDSAKVLESRKEQVTLKTGAVEAQYALIRATITISGQQTAADVKVWSSLKTPGLILKQIAVLTNVPVAGQATISDELTSPE